jgi:hypothetical protein
MQLSKRPEAGNYYLNPFALNAYSTQHRDFYDPDHLNHKNGYSFRGMLQRQIKDPENTKDESGGNSLLRSIRSGNQED